MKKKLFLFILVIFLASAILVNAPELTPVKTDYLKYEGKEVSITKSCSFYKICNPTMIDVSYSIKSKDTFDWVFNEVKGEVKNSWFEILENESYGEWLPNFICEGEIDYYDPYQEKWVKVPNCTDEGGIVTKYKEVWKKFNPIGYIFKANKCYHIKICGTYDPKPIAIDNVLSIAGYVYNEYDWWNLSCQNSRPVSITNAPSHPYPALILINSANFTDANEDLTDLYLIDNDNTTEIGFLIENYDSSNNYTASPQELKIRFNESTSATRMWFYYNCTGVSVWSGIRNNVSHVYPQGTYIRMSYDFEDSTTWIYDKSVNNNTATAINGTAKINTTNAGCYQGYCLELDGTNDVIEFGEDSSMDITGEFSISLWVKYTKTNGWQSILIKGDAGGGAANVNYITEVIYPEDVSRCGFKTSSTWYYDDSATVLSANTLYHVVWTFNDTSNDFKVYLNGSSNNNHTQTGVMTADNNKFQIGCSNDAGSFANCFGGYVDNINIWNRELSQIEAENLYSATEPSFTIEAEETQSADPPPQWSNNVSSIVTPYDDTTKSEFNITFDGASSVNIELNDTGTPYNCTASNTYGGDIWNCTKVLNANFDNQQYWKVYGTNASGTNTTPSWDFTINRANNPVNLWFNENLDTNLTITVPENLTVRFSGVSATLWTSNEFNNTWYNISEKNNTIQSLKANTVGQYVCGDYGYHVNATASLNYLSNTSYQDCCTELPNATCFFVHVNKGVMNLNITINTSESIVEGTIVNITCENITGSIPGSISVNLYNNTSQLINNPYDFNTTGQVGINNFICNTTGNENYTSNSTSRTLTVTLSAGLYVYNVTKEEDIPNTLTFNITVYNSTTTQTVYNITSYENNSITGDVTVEIWSENYPKRRRYALITVGSTVGIEGYLLHTSNGQYVSFYVMSPQETGISGAEVTARRLIGSNWIIMEQRRTDTSGVATLFLDYTNNYKIDISAADYTTINTSVTPTQTGYKIYMTSASSVLNYSALFDDVYYSLQPYGQVLYGNNSYDFNYTINSTNSSLEWWGWNFTYFNGTTLHNANVTNSSGGTLSYTLNTTNLANNLTVKVFFKKVNYTWYSKDYLYYIYQGLNASNISAEGVAESIKTGAIDLPMEAFAIISIFATAAAAGVSGSVVKAKGAGLLGLVVLGIFTYLGTTIYGVAYWFGWFLFLMTTLITLSVMHRTRL